MLFSVSSGQNELSFAYFWGGEQIFEAKDEDALVSKAASFYVGGEDIFTRYHFVAIRLWKCQIEGSTRITVTRAKTSD